MRHLDVPFTATVDRYGPASVVTVTGELDLFTCDGLRTRLAPLLTEGADVRLDLGEVTFIDASAIALLVGVQRRAARVGFAFSAEPRSVVVDRTLAMCGLDQIL